MSETEHPGEITSSETFSEKMSCFEDMDSPEGAPAAEAAGSIPAPAEGESAAYPKLDRRQRKTRQAIYRAFEELMGEMHYSAVTVVQIIERADIGRSTFYAHFETKEDLLDDMCADMFGHVFEGVNEYCVGHEDLNALDLAGKLAHLLYHLRDSYNGVCSKLIAEGEPHFTARFKQELETLFAREAANPATPVPADLLASIQASAFMEMVSWWLTAKFAVTPEAIAGWFCSTLRA